MSSASCSGPRPRHARHTSRPPSTPSTSPRRTPRRRSTGRRPARDAAGRDGFRGRRQWPLPKQAVPGRAAPRGQGPQDPFHARIGDGQGGRRGLVHARRRRGARDRRRIRLRQDHDRAVARQAPALERADRRGEHQAVRDRSRAQVRERDAALPLARDLDRLPGRDERPQPGPPGRRADRRAARGTARTSTPTRRGSGRASCSSWWASRAPGGARTRTSCRVGCASER